MEVSFFVEILAVAGAVLAGVMTPGPDFITASHIAVHSGRRNALLAVAGIATGSMAWAVLSLAGLQILFQTYAWTFLLIKTAGACYLLYLGAQMLFRAARPIAVAEGRPVCLRGWRAFRQGLLTDMSNPKTAVFFTSLFALVMPQSANLWQQVAIVLTVGAVAFGWYGFVATAMSLTKVAALYARAQRAITAATGGLLAFMGGKLMLERQV